MNSVKFLDVYSSTTLAYEFRFSFLSTSFLPGISASLFRLILLLL